MSTIKIGALVDGRYRIEARIGHGGMAEVYEATDIINRRKVAIKMIREDVMKNPNNFGFCLLNCTFANEKRV